MQRYRTNSESGFHYRLTILIVLIILFVAIVAQRIGEMRVVAERTHVAWMVGAMQSALGIEVVRRAAKGGLDEIGALNRSNPIKLLNNQQPTMMVGISYLGELKNPDPHKIAPGSWYFNTQSRELVYRVIMDDAFTTNLSGPARIRFSLMARYATRGEHRTLSGLSLVALDEYHWSTNNRTNGLD